MALAMYEIGETQYFGTSFSNWPGRGRVYNADFLTMCYLWLFKIYPDSDIQSDLSEDAELILEKYRREALEDLQLHYRNDLGLRDYATRLGNLMTANHAIQVSYIFQ